VRVGVQRHLVPVGGADPGPGHRNPAATQGAAVTLILHGLRASIRPGAIHFIERSPSLRVSLVRSHETYHSADLGWGTATSSYTMTGTTSRDALALINFKFHTTRDLLGVRGDPPLRRAGCGVLD
jgi:hypothetical protein